jgi:transposase InsO family protein
MPWKEETVMEQKRNFILQVLKGEKPIKQLCVEFGISEKTGHKWKNRFEQDGFCGLEEQSRRPRSSPNGLFEDVVTQLVAIKVKHPAWGPKKILAIYARTHTDPPSLSAVSRILAKAGMTKRRHIKKIIISSSRAFHARILPEAPNDVWAIDFKGWWRSDGEKCDPFTVRDLASKFVICTRLMESQSGEAVKAVMKGLFRKYGLPKVIRSDNGTPFCSSSSTLTLTKLSAWWITLGIIPDRTDPGTPGQNGSLERMHGDIAKEIEGRVRGGVKGNQAALDVWREEYNNERPNEAIGMRTPAEVYTPSERKYTGDYDVLEYPMGFLPRKVQKNGVMVLDNQHIYVTMALADLTVGLLPREDGKYSLFLCEALLGEVDSKLCCFTPAEVVKFTGGGCKEGEAPIALHPLDSV